MNKSLDTIVRSEVIVSQVVHSRNKWGALHSYNDMPSITYEYGAVEWHKQGHVHREGAPAYIGTHIIEWWIDGCLMSFDKYCAIMNYSNEEILMLRLRWL